MKVKGEGILRHMFHGTYRAAIALAFADAASAADAARALGEGWKHLEQQGGRGLVWSGETEALERVKKTLARHGYATLPCGFSHCRHACREAPIDNCNHSVDFGAKFTVEVCVFGGGSP